MSARTVTSLKTSWSRLCLLAVMLGVSTLTFATVAHAEEPTTWILVQPNPRAQAPAAAANITNNSRHLVCDCDDEDHDPQERIFFELDSAREHWEKYDSQFGTNIAHRVELIEIIHITPPAGSEAHDG